MADWVGTDVVRMLEEAGKRLLATSDPELYRCFLLHIGGAPTLRRYDASECYWVRVQSVLDGFFSAAERAEICGHLIAHPELRARPEFRGFLASALAERRLQNLVVAARLRSPAASR